MYINSNVTPEQFFRDHCTDDNAKRFYEDLIEDNESFDAERKEEQRQLELAEEQVYFARNLIEKINYILKTYDNKAGAVKLKQSISDAISDSMFEV